MRPQSLAAVGAIAIAHPAHFTTALNEFLDEFYLDHPDKAAQQARIAEAPLVVGDARVDAWIGASGEHLALRWKLHVPAWTARKEHFALARPLFMPDAPEVRGMLIVASPPSFRARLIFTGPEPLDRARFPRGVEKSTMPLPWPPARASDVPAPGDTSSGPNRGTLP